MKRITILAICVLVLGSWVWGLGQTPPLPPGVTAAASVAVEPAVIVTPTATNLVSIRIVRYTPQISRMEFYCATNRPLRWRLEDSTNLIHWRLVEKYDGTNDPAPKIPMLRDNARLVTSLLVSPQTQRAFYRLRPLP